MSYNGYNNKSLNIPTITGLSDILADTINSTNAIVDDSLTVNGVDITNQININTNNIANLQQITTDISYTAGTDTTNINNNLKLGGNLDMSGNNILNVDSLRGETDKTLHVRSLGTGALHLQTAGTNDRLTINDAGLVTIVSNNLNMNNNNITSVDSLRGETNSTLHIRSLGTGDLHLQTSGTNDRLTIDETGLVKIVANNLDMSGNDIVNCDNLQANTINGSTIPTLSNIAYTNQSNTFTLTNDFQRIHQTLPNSNFVFGTSTTLSSVTTGNNNICVGSGAGQTLTTGIQNIFIGNNAGNLYNNQNMIAIGFGALDVCTASGGSQAIGTGCLGSLTTGTSNTGNGNNALRDVVTGLRNTAMGQAALRDVVGSASDNTAIGANAGLNVVNATNNNTFIGSQTGFSSTGDTYNNSTALGYNVKITASNKIFLGTSTEITYAQGGLMLNNSSTVLNMNGNNITNAKQIIGTTAVDIDLIANGTAYITFNSNNTLRGYITNAGLFKILTNIECDNNTKTGSLSVTNDMDISGNIKLSTTQLPFTAGELGSSVQTVAVGANTALTSNTIANIHTVTLPLGVYLLTYTFRITQTSGSRQNATIVEKGISTANNTLITTAGNSLYTTYNKLINTSTQVIGLASGETGFYSYTDSVTTGGGTFYLNVRLTFTGSDWTARMEQFDYIRIG